MNWNLTDEEADYIMRCLMARPFVEVAKLITKLQEQANAKHEPKASPHNGGDSARLEADGESGRHSGVGGERVQRRRQGHADA